jgi:16S rRNA processing protein RimM
MDGSADDLVAVGRVGRARGVRGEVFIAPWTDDPDDRFAVGCTLLTDPADRGPLTVAAMSAVGAKLVVRFEGVDDRTAAEGLRGTLLLVRAGERPPLDDPDDFYDTDLIGLQAVDDDGTPIGPVCDVVHGPGSDFLVVQTGGAQSLVPFVKAIVPTVDVAGGQVVITAPDGLFDL